MALHEQQNAPATTDWNDMMNSHLTYLMAQDMASDRRRRADEARLARQALATPPVKTGRIGRTLAGFRIRVNRTRPDAAIEPLQR